eukprot:m.64195 g.64195  ORF g.64195 m.64195 type:complete len:303 (-) comp11991_c0_seq3:609-1517(-)
MRRVVVTGLGTVNPVGLNVQSTWTRLLAGHCGVDIISPLEDYASCKIPTTVAAQVCLGPEDEAKHKLIQHQPASITFSAMAASEAIQDAGITVVRSEGDPDSAGSNGMGSYDSRRVGVAIGCGISGLQGLLAAHTTLHTRGYSRISPYLIPNSLTNMAAGLISIKYGFQGPNHSVSTACATGGHSIVDAVRMIRCNEADAMIAGASDACITPVVVAGFARARALAHPSYKETPQAASRPFDAARSGFVIGEGAGVVVLEETPFRFKLRLLGIRACKTTRRPHLRRGDRLWLIRRCTPHHSTS